MDGLRDALKLAREPSSGYWTKNLPDRSRFNALRNWCPFRRKRLDHILQFVGHLFQLLNRSSVNIMMTLSSHIMSTRPLLSRGPSSTFRTARCRIVTGRRWLFSEMMSRDGVFKRYDLPCMGASFYREGRGTPSACVYD